MKSNDSGLRVLTAEEGRHYNVLGSAMIYKATSQDTGGAYSLAVETTPPHAGLPMHVHHREDEAMYILDGEYEIKCGADVFRATPGTFVFLPRDTPNGYMTCGETPGRFIYITSPGGFEALVAETSEVTMQGKPDMHAVHAIANRHGVDFV